MDGFDAQVNNAVRDCRISGKRTSHGTGRGAGQRIAKGDSEVGETMEEKFQRGRTGVGQMVRNVRLASVRQGIGKDFEGRGNHRKVYNDQGTTGCVAGDGSCQCITHQIDTYTILESGRGYRDAVGTNGDGNWTVGERIGKVVWGHETPRGPYCT